MKAPLRSCLSGSPSTDLVGASLSQSASAVTLPRVCGAALLLLFPCSHASGTPLVQFGQEGQITWEGEVVGSVEGVDEILTAQPEYRTDLDPDLTEIGVDPGGGLIELANEDFPGALLPRRIGEGKNLATTSLARGGSIGSRNVFGVAQSIYDALISPAVTSTAFERKTEPINGSHVDLDLGTRVGVRRIRFFPRNTVYEQPEFPFQNDFLRNFKLFVNDGLALTASGSPIWGQPFHERTDNRDPVIVIEVDPPRYLKSIRIRTTSDIPFEIQKLQVFGVGFFPAARYISPVIDLQTSVNWGQLRWLEEALGQTVGSQLQIRTHTGLDGSPLTYTRRQVGVADAPEIGTSRNNPGQPLGREEYLDLPVRGGSTDAWERGSVGEDLENWSPWTAPYDRVAATSESGTPVLSPGPRRYLQFRVDFRSTELEATRVLRNLSIEISPALAAELVAEVYPREVPPAQDISFIYAVKTDMSGADGRGFNSFEMSTPNRVRRIERLEIFDADGQSLVDHTFAVQDDVTDEGDVAITTLSEDGFTLRFPRIDENALLKIHFVDRVLTYSSTYDGRALLPEEDAFQNVVAGDAAALDAADESYLSGITVLSPSVTGIELLGSFVMGPAITPDGDGVNDRLTLRFEVLTVVGESRIGAGVFDLSGRRRAALLEHAGGNGVYESSRFPGLAWDGRDQQGQLVPPGVYLIRVEVEGDARSSTAVHPVSVVY